MSELVEAEKLTKHYKMGDTVVRALGWCIDSCGRRRVFGSSGHVGLRQIHIIESHLQASTGRLQEL
jgi:hypothetical protein